MCCYTGIIFFNGGCVAQVVAVVVDPPRMDATMLFVLHRRTPKTVILKLVNLCQE